ncbi:hypothetical protein SAMN02910298_00026 [Pseudobutyrivibrio sp. YE44]|uniref:hypothetical protein n=1 Tax=Pseudobutyrivibrio sp. YE44 TaxID=1520802 RepID=UPI0008917E17|nr:hypothetical protein [Pseudobutyrivibrio sp. YE44]SDB04258.1 hypothetical protein SAMN02910298_00026 [Pseudobutyrivibrio sp. YE44]
MQGEYKGRDIFRRRYVGMDEDAIRQEISRLQEELYSMQDALDYLYDNSKESKALAAEVQVKNERLLKGIDVKMSKLQRSLDYEAPIKSQLDKVTGEISEKIETANNQRWGKLMALAYINTGLIVILAALVIGSIFFF